MRNSNWLAHIRWLSRRWRRAHRLFRQLKPLPRGARIVDVGACRGSFTDAALIYWNPSRVWLVEAQPEFVKALRARYCRNRICTVVHCAIAAAPGEIDLRLNDHPESSSILAILPQTSTIYRRSLKERDWIRVPAQTLDGLFEAEGIDRVHLMKVDIQGAEKQLIQGGQNALRRVDQLFIEVMFEEQYAGAATFSQIQEMLAALGFKLRGFSPGRLGADGALAYTDALFIRPQAAG